MGNQGLQTTRTLNLSVVHKDLECSTNQIVVISRGLDQYALVTNNIACFVDEESQTPSLSQSAPAESLSVPSGDSDGSLIGGGNTSHDKLIEDEPLYQEYHECMLSHVKANSISKSEL